MHPRRFVWVWLIIALTLVGLLALAMLSDSAAAQDDAPAPAGDEAALHTLVEAMEAAVRAEDRDAYLHTVDLSDALFRSEHTYWIDDWTDGAPLDRFSLDLTDVRVDGDRAVGTLSMLWARRPDVSYRKADFPALFTRDAAGEWRFAGGAWHTLETERFLVHVFPGMEPVGAELIAILPAIYDHVVTSVGYAPDTVMHIKLYDHPDDLGALTALSLPTISGWNEPGESLKLLVLPGESPSAAVIAHELTHFLTFEMAGSTHGSYPWWLMEGIAEYVASAYWSTDDDDRRIDAVQMWAAADTLAPWDQISDFEATPVDLWRYVYPQGYAFVRYVSEVYGEDARSAWLAALAGENAVLEVATETAFDTTFDALSADFMRWLATAD